MEIATFYISKISSMSLGHHLSSVNNNTLTEFPPFMSTPGLNYYTDKTENCFSDQNYN